MMRNKLLLFFLGWAFIPFAQDVVTTGKIGKYPIEITIEKIDHITGDFSGKYRYEGKSKYLLLMGRVYDNVIYLEESYKGEETGAFFLEYEEGQFVGKWIGESSWYDVVVESNAEVLKKIETKSLEEYQAETTAAVSGTYSSTYYYLNDMWFSEDSPNMEIGFSGGDVAMDQFHPDSIHFLVEVICGPTYHIAYADGIASRTGENTFECVLDETKEDTCVILIALQERAVSMVARGNFICGFGARAYLDHEFIKISDEAKFEEEE